MNEPRPRLLCPECGERLMHRLVTLHAEADTVLICTGLWESLPKWMREGIEKRREIVREIKEHCEAHG